MSTGKKCLKCGYTRQPGDISPDTDCPQCGAIYAKVEAAARAARMKAEQEAAIRAKEEMRARVEAEKEALRAKAEKETLPPVRKDEPTSRQTSQPAVFTELKETSSGETVITGIKIPFWEMVSFLVELAVASIPAAIIVFFLFAAFWAVWIGGLAMLPR